MSDQEKYLEYLKSLSPKELDEHLRYALMRYININKVPDPKMKKIKPLLNLDQKNEIEREFYFKKIMYIEGVPVVVEVKQLPED